MSEQTNNAVGLIHKVAELIREQLTTGQLIPNQKLSEAALSEEFNISRNTLREAFRLLTKEGLLRHEPNRGVFVAMPSMASIIDIYRVRRMIECQALLHAYPKHPALKKMDTILEKTLEYHKDRNWNAIGTSNIEFHAAIVELADSERLNSFFSNISTELRLAFGILNDPEYLHEPFIDMNVHIYQLFKEGKVSEATDYLDHYLTHSERMILASYARHFEMKE